MTDDVVHAALLLRTCMEVLREHAGPVSGREVIAEVASRLSLTDYEREPIDDSGQPRWENHLRWRTGHAATIGWLTKIDGWAITEAGESALDTFLGDALWGEFTRRFNESRRQRKQAQQRLSGAEQRIAQTVDLVGSGFWTSHADLAELTGVDPATIAHFLAQAGPVGSHRVLRPDGTVPPEGLQHFRYRGGDLSAKLASEGVEFDQRGHASPRQRVTAEALRAQLVETDPADQTPTRRAWLVRGSSVEGLDLVHVWLHKGSISLAASGLRAISPPVARAELKSFVEEDYQHKPYSAREAKIAEFDAFCNRMRAGDLVLTTTQGKAYLGRVTGDAEYVSSSDQRSNLRRTVDWLNDTRPVAFNRLPDPLPAKLHNQSDVVDLTENLAAIETLLRELDVEVDTPTPAPQKALTFAPIGAELANELMIDPAWLQRQADLLWHRRQLILYGPPGTGKTFLARKIAQHLAEPSAVKLVQFHPSYTYEDFFEGFRPVQRDDGQLAFELRPGPFRALVDDARQHPSDPYLLIIDEINRANLAKVFGELYFLLEYRDDSISLLYSTEADFTLPKNVFVIGTMNTTDRSIALVDAAMRRRFAFVELHPSQPPTSGLLREWLRRRTEAGEVAHHADAADLLDALNRAIDDRDLAVGPSYLMHRYVYQRPDALAEVWDTSILPLLEEHHYGSPREILDRYRLDTLRKSLDAGSDEP
ncbi:MAG: AAA domain-containing protein [Actinophytocola sp.]|uniref:AAA family ATPase n=1 Tax=Actinophytocola sp. TaxID=1872138 RepID=UPI0013254B33|nr:AAA family ATPase [Actinophytocola sp.]MPZ80003.1 AAA domain-containing protein [Actinophytocola sp.]